MTCTWNLDDKVCDYAYGVCLAQSNSNGTITPKSEVAERECAWRNIIDHKVEKGKNYFDRRLFFPLKFTLVPN